MGNDKTTTKGETSVTATPEEKQLEQMQLQRQQANAGNQQTLDNNQYNLANLLLTGQNLPGNLQGAAGISDAQNQSMVNQSIRSVLPQFQSAGILDSGIAAQGAINAAQNTSNQNAQFNVSAFQNLLNQGLGGSSNLTGANNSSNQILGNQLAGLRTTNTRGSTIGMNPFLKSFQTSLGTSLGSGSFGQGGGSGGGSQGGISAAAQMAAAGCWVAAEIFGGWYHPKTVMARYYVNNIAPLWFKEFYLKYGENIALYISNKFMLKLILRPLFEMFVMVAENEVCYGR